MNTAGKQAYHGIGSEEVNPTLRKPRPTTALPGSDEKRAVLLARAVAGEELWHADDADWEDAGLAVLMGEAGIKEERLAARRFRLASNEEGDGDD